MRTTLRSIAIALAATIGMAALAQPYTVTVTGIVSGCTPQTAVTIVSLPTVTPPANVTVALSPPACTFSQTFVVDVPAGGFTVSVPCLGAIQSQVVQYQVTFIDSTLVSVLFNCDSTIDCLGVAGGSALPGTPCTTSTGVIGVWNSSCDCVATSYWDCLGVPGGPDVPGAPCDFMGLPGTWTVDCACDTLGTTTDCMGILNGPNMPGTPCANPATGITGTWTANCECQPITTLPCQAGFWVMQAYTADTLNPGTATPIPFELWVWNLSTGTSPFQYYWDFGDGTTSTDAFPSHTYPGPGPYMLCLTIADASGCTSTACDSIQVDQDGLLGMSLGPEVRSQLTINVIQSLPTGITERPVLEGTRLWPNPVNDHFTLMLNSSRSGTVELSIIDLNGREVQRGNLAIFGGMNTVRLAVDALESGMYLIRLQHGQAVHVLRFVKD